MGSLRILMLGPFQVVLGDQPVTAFGTDSARALLAYLAVEAGWRSETIAHRRQALAGLLWPDRPEAAARHALAQTLTRLRRALGDRDADSPYLLVSREALQFNLATGCWLDVAIFDQAIEACTSHAHRRLESCSPCIERLRGAVALYRGELMAGFALPSAPFEEWLLNRREALRLQALDALHALASYHERRAEHEQALSYARRQLELEPWHEAAHRQAMRALAQNGQRDAALAQYQTCRRVLAQELGVEPDRETTALYERLRDAADLSGSPNLTNLRTAPPNNLPAPLAPFVGRERELAQIAERLQDPACRLLTLVGLGGSGKTRLALEAAEEQAHTFAHGVFWVPLAAVDTPEGIVPAIAQALGFTFQAAARPRQSRSQRQELLDHLRGKEMLLVLDNCEQLLAGLESAEARLLADLLAAAPAVKVLVTSRARLNLQGEEVLLVGGMDCPPLQPFNPPSFQSSALTDDLSRYGAVALFLHAARRSRPEYCLTAEDVPHVVHICHLVEGMPLGILLAAAWVTVLSPAEIARQLTTEAGRSLDFLSAEWPDAPERHRSMRAVMDSCWGMLTEREQQVFAALAVFRGGFTHDAAQQVVGSDLSRGQGLLPTLRSLVHKSFLQVDQEGRYAVHELLRQYGEHKLSADPLRLKQVRERHAACYTGAAVGWEAGLKGMRGREVLAEMGLEIHNAQVAWQWLSERRDAARLAQMIHAMGQFYASRGWYQQGERAFDTAVDRLLSAEQPAVEIAPLQHIRGRLLTWQGRYAFASARGANADELLRRAQAALDEAERAGQDVRAARAWMLRSLGEVAADVDRGAFRGLAEQSLALYRELDDPWGIVVTLSDLGIAFFLDGAYRQTREIFEECLALSQKRGIADDHASSAFWLSLTAAAQGETERAERMVRELEGPALASHDRMARAGGLWSLGTVLSECAQYAAAEPVLEEGVTLLRELGADVLLYRLLVSLALTKLHLGQYEQARELGRQEVERARQMRAWPFAGLALAGLAQASIAAGAYEEAARTLDESIATLRPAGARAYLGRALGSMAYAVRRLGQTEQAWECVGEALRLGLECQAVHPLLFALPAAALLLADRGQSERAVELYALASRYPVVANSCWFEDVAGRQLAGVAAGLPEQVRAMAQARGQARDLWATGQGLLAEVEEERA
jgi:predicted ATPase/DNA-binding SARP family transcriptional activator